MIDGLIPILLLALFCVIGRLIEPFYGEIESAYRYFDSKVLSKIKYRATHTWLILVKGKPSPYSKEITIQAVQQNFELVERRSVVKVEERSDIPFDRVYEEGIRLLSYKLRDYVKVEIIPWYECGVPDGMYREDHYRFSILLPDNNREKEDVKRSLRKAIKKHQSKMSGVGV